MENKNQDLKCVEVEKKNEDVKLIFSTIEKAYDNLKKDGETDIVAKYKKKWIDNNWKSITDAMADLMIEMADDECNDDVVKCVDCSNVDLEDNMNEFRGGKYICQECINDDNEGEILLNCCNVCDIYYYTRDDMNDYDDDDFDGDTCPECTKEMGKPTYEVNIEEAIRAIIGKTHM